MKKLLTLLAGSVLVLSCQTSPQRYFTSCPEIDLVKSGNAAYVAGDWQALRALYADTAKIYDNVWPGDPALSADDFLNRLQTTLADMTDYGIDENAVYEMVITDEGQKWVHNWLQWRGRHKNGSEIHFPIHLAFLVVDNKVVTQAMIYNALPGYLASQPMPEAEVSTKE